MILAVVNEMKRLFAGSYSMIIEAIKITGDVL
jgi:hypothetical protein